MLLRNLRDKLLELPDVRKFDRQFTPVPSVIKARIKREYDVYQGIKLQITDEIDKIEEVIYSDVSNEPRTVRQVAKAYIADSNSNYGSLAEANKTLVDSFATAEGEEY